MFKRFWWVLLIVLILGPVLGLFTGGVLAYIQPKLYESSATIQITSSSHQTAERNIATQAEVITSESVLNEVAEKLDLVTAWNVPLPEITAKLKHTISVKHIRGTDLLEVSARLPLPESSRDVVESVVETYTNRRNQVLNEAHQQGLAELRDAIQAQEDSVEEKRKVVAQLMTAEGSPEAAPADNLAMEDARADLTTAQSLLEQLKIKEVGAQMEHKLIASPVIIHSAPIMSHVPVSPNIRLNLVAGTAVGLLGGLLLALPIMALLNRRATR